MPWEGRSGLDDAPTTAMVLASTRSRRSSSAEGGLYGTHHFSQDPEPVIVCLACPAQVSSQLLAAEQLTEQELVQVT